VDDKESDLKNCLLLLTEFPPKITPGVHRSLRFCRHLREFGWNPIVLTMGQDQDNTQEFLRSLPEGMLVARLSVGRKERDSNALPSATQNNQTGTAPEPTGLKAFLKRRMRPLVRLITETPDKNYAWAKLAGQRGCELVHQHNAQVVFSSGPPHSTHLGALAISKRCNIPLVVDLRDPWGRKPWKNHDNPLRDYVLPWYERRVVRAASQVVLNTETSLEDFRKHYPDQFSKFSCIPNGLDSHLIDQVAKLHPSSQSNHWPVLIHPGNLYGHRDPVPLIKAVAKLRDQGRHVRFRQIGSIDPHYNAESLVQTLGLQEHVSIESPVPHSQVLEAMQDSDVLVIIQPDAPFMVPAKVFEMMAFDQPILSISDSPCTEAIVVQAGGACAPSRDVDRIAMSIEKTLDLLSTPELRDARGESRKTYDAKRLTGQLAEAFNTAAP
jgi:glycosyltransferase involved in cell wall biosynthesis